MMVHSPSIKDCRSAGPRLAICRLRPGELDAPFCIEPEVERPCARPVAPHSGRASTPAVQGLPSFSPTAGVFFFSRHRPCRGGQSRRIEMPDPSFPHATKNHFPLPGVIKLDPLRLPSDAEPLDFMLAVMRDEAQPIWRRIEAAKAAAPYRHIRIDSEFCRHLSKAQLDQIKNARVLDHKRS
jgi:hypothetical protein